MRSICTSLGTWDTIETGISGRHSMTFPLAIMTAVMADAGYPAPVCWEGDERPAERAADAALLLISCMDSRHFWRIPRWLDEVGCPRRADERGESDPIVIVGGQAASAPAPIEHLADVVYVGEAEARLPDLLAVLDSGAPRAIRLEAAASVPGCLVPSMLPAKHRVQMVYADDIGISLRRRLNVNLRSIHRVEISRGCRSACGFCALGWRSRYRENDLDDIAAALVRGYADGVNEIHLSAGDAESHSQIAELRKVVSDLGLRDHGWTGRLDSMSDCSVSAGKLFAFGLEGMSWRLRRAVGKPRLTDDYITQQIAGYWRSGGRRLMLHMIGGLPGETDSDADEFRELLRAIESVVGDRRQHIEIGRQPFGPLPHTPMQWFAPGLTTSAIGRASAPYTRDAQHYGMLAVIDKSGQSYPSALINSVVMRGGREVQRLVDTGPPRLPRTPARALGLWMEWLSGAGLDPYRYICEWNPDGPTPWAHIQTAHSVDSLKAAHRACRRRLGLA